jgi:triacylglycerol lipase
MHQWRHAGKRILTACAGAAIVSVLAAGNAMAQTEAVIFVHGYSGSTSNFNTMVSRFTGDGYPSAKLYRFGYNSFVNSDKTSASQLSNFVATVRANNANENVSIVAHSNGGLVSRWFRAKLGGTAVMRRFVTLGTPHLGTQSAYACTSPACFDMRPGSAFLKDLGSAGCDRSLWSAADEVIVPVQNAKCGTNVQTANVSHNTLLTDASVYTQVRAQLK